MGSAQRSFFLGCTVLAGSLLAAACGSTEPAPGGRQPSVILISFDTCRADVFGALSGTEPSLTPRLDELAADSVVFENAFVQAPHTLPSHMSLFTSVYPDVHGVKPDFGPLSESFVTLPEILQHEGFGTVGLVTSEWLKPDFGFGRGFDEYELLPHRPTYAERVNAAALRHLRSRGPAGPPLFLFLHYYDLHSDFEQGGANKLPYYSPPEYREGLDLSPDGREFCDDEGNCNTRYLMEMDRERQEMPQSKIHTIHDLYRAAVPHLDAQMGELFDELKRRGLYDSSLIIVTSDHGEEFREHGRFIHSQPYDETIRVPLFIKFPESWKEGARVSAVAETVDILPTLLDYLELNPPAYAQGESLLGFVEEGATAPRRKDAVLSQDTINLTRYGLRTDHFKLIKDLKGGRRELYDLRSDPDEQTNLAEKRPNVADELEGRLETLFRTNRKLNRERATGGGADEDILSTEEKERLEALGYLN